MNLTYKQAFIQQKNLQQTLYGKFGYSIESMNQMVQKKKKNDNYPVIANIKLRKVTPSLYKNDRIQQVEKQIQQLKKDRKRRQQQSKATKIDDPNKFINKMEHIVSQYNYLIDHKHIKQKGTDEARKMLNIQPKTQAEKALEQILVLKDQLVHANIQQQFVLNKRINDLYRLFKDRLDDRPVDGKGTNRKRAVSENMTKTNEKSSSFRVMSRMMQESHRASSIASKLDSKKTQRNNLNLTLGQSLHSHLHSNLHSQKPIHIQKSQNYLNISLNQGHMRKIKSHSQQQYLNQTCLNPIDESSFNISPQPQKQQSKSAKQKQQLNKEILQPYVSREFIQNGKKMDVKIKNNVDALELWKGRIAQATVVPEVQQRKSTKKMTEESPYLRPFNQEEEQEKLYNKINDHELQLKQHIPYIQNKKMFKHQTVESLKAKNVEQQNILSGILNKRNCKYLRPWGTKILVKYNAAKQAKQMLGLSPTKDNKDDKSQSQTQLNSKPKQQVKLNLNLSFKDNQKSQQLDWDKQIDQEYYWTMCKNEKINLLLKGKRR